MIDPVDLVLWEDEWMLVVNKPAGTLSVPDGYRKDAPHLRVLLEPQYGRLWVVHRLDRDTSGVIVFARSSGAHSYLTTRFEKRELSKVYHALVEGTPSWDVKTVEFPLCPDGDRKHRTIIDNQVGMFACTDLRVLDRFAHYALIEAKPRTGRTHQIRVHLSALRCPIVGDGLYGRGENIFLSRLKPGYRTKENAERPLLGRLGLHARTISVPHPLNEKVMTFEAPYPKDFQVTLKQLRKYDSSN